MSEGLKPAVDLRVNQSMPSVTAASPLRKELQTKEFEEILKNKIGLDLKFSSHALERLEKRNIAFDTERLKKLGAAVQKAEEKGSRTSLVLMDNLALVVSIKNYTVITAMDSRRLKENVFTNIDSAVFI